MFRYARNLATPEAQRGFVLLSLMIILFGAALSILDNIVTNFFSDELGLAGPQFGYITAIREVPGFLLIFLTAIFYKMSIPRLTAMMLLVLMGGMLLYGTADSFWSVAPWVVISSMGYHTVLQTQYALGLSLTTQDRAGSLLGRITAYNNAGAVAAMVVVLIGFEFGWLDFTTSFILAGLCALLAAVAIFRFPVVHDGQPEEVHVDRPRMVLRGSYRYYYYLHLLDGARMQIFFSFGLFVLVSHYGLDVQQITALAIATRLVAMFSGPVFGVWIDRLGEKSMLGALNIVYILALAGYALIDNVWVAAAIYLVYAVVFPLSGIGSATYLRKVAVREEIAPSLAMGVTLSHAAAIIVPITTGYILNYVSYQVPFLIACIFATATIFVTRRLDPRAQRSPARIAEDEAYEATLRTPQVAPATGNGGT